MRRHPTPIGWVKRAPRRYRFSVSNVAWDYGLKPIEFAIFSYLCYHHYHHYHRVHNQIDISTEQAIASNVHLTTNTVKKYLSALANKGVISTGWSIAPQFQYTNNEKFFTLPNEVFLLKLPSSAFMVYAYLLLIKDRRTHTSYPSYNTIAAATRISENTAMKSISALLEAELITVEANSYFSYFDKRGKKWKGNNLYTILPIKTEFLNRAEPRQDHQKWQMNPRYFVAG